MNTSHDHDGQGPKPALVSALTTEHFALQATRSSTVIEANGRSQLFLSALTGAVVALALVAELDELGRTFTVFALSLLPAVLALGLTTYVRLADLAVQDAFYARAIGRIRAFYLTIEPSAQHYFAVPAGDHPHAVMLQSGQRRRSDRALPTLFPAPSEPVEQPSAHPHGPLAKAAAPFPSPDRSHR